MTYTRILEHIESYGAEVMELDMSSIRVFLEEFSGGIIRHRSCTYELVYIGFIYEINYKTNMISSKHK